MSGRDGSDRRSSRESSGERGGGGGSSSSSLREDRSGSSDKKKAGKQEGLKADLLQIARGAVSAFLKGSPPQARESGLIFDLHSTRYKDSKEAKNRAASPKARGSPRSVSSGGSSGSSTRASSSDRRTSSSSSHSHGHGHHSNRSRHNAIQRPWQVHGDAPPDMEVEYAEEFELREPSGSAEAAVCAEKVRALLKKSRQTAWTNLKKELDVQRMIWESLALARRGPGGTEKEKKEKAVTPEERIIADFDKALKASVNDADNAVVLLQDIVERDANGSKLLSNSVLAKSDGCIKAERVAGNHRTLEEWLLDAGKRGSLYRQASPEDAQDADAEEESRRIYTVQELSELLLACELKDNQMVYCICRVVSWLAGAPQSGASLPLAMGTADPGDQEDPYSYFPPDPSVSPPGSNEGSGEGGPRRLDLTSLQQKQQKRQEKEAKAEGSTPKEEAEPASPKKAPRSPPPSLPPPSKLPDFPRYALSDPFSLIPLASYPTGLAKDLHADERSTTAGSGIAEARSVGSDATCGSWDEEHRARCFLAL